jgi:acyl-CoA thioesterase-1
MNLRADSFALAFGDSLTAGYGLTRAEAFPARLEALLRERAPAASVQNAGVSGDTTGSGLARLPRLLASLRRKPDLAIVELGANDMLRFVDPVVTERNLDAILDQFEACDIRVLVAGMMAPPFLGERALRFNALFPALAARRAVALYPFFMAGAIGRPELTLRDGLHPSARAIEIIARSILPSVEAALA